MSDTNNNASSTAGAGSGSGNSSGGGGSGGDGVEDMMDEYAQLPRLAGVLETVKRHCNDKNIDLSTDTRNAIWQLIVAEDRSLIAAMDANTGREALTTAVLELVRQRGTQTPQQSNISSNSSAATTNDSSVSSPVSSTPSSLVPASSPTSVDIANTRTVPSTVVDESSASSASATTTTATASSSASASSSTVVLVPTASLTPVSVSMSTSTASTSSSMSLSPSPSSSNVVDAVTEIALSGALDAFAKNKPPAIKSSAKAMVNILTQLKANPSDQSKRKMRLDHIIVKKQIVEVPGAQSFMLAIGFRVSVEADKKSYLIIDDTTLRVEVLIRAIELLNERISEADTPAAAQPVDTIKRLCVAGCGFWGDSQWEGMCSQCFRNRNSSAKKSTEHKSAGAKKCSKGCGFFGAERFGGMCSVCHSKEPKVVKHWRKKWQHARLKLRAVGRFLHGKRAEQVDKKRCWTCRKKIGISAGLECRCGYIFCSTHRFPHEHGCTFDFKEHHKRKLMAENRIVAGKKFDRIDERDDDEPSGNKDDKKSDGTGGGGGNAGNKSPRR